MPPGRHVRSSGVGGWGAFSAFGGSGVRNSVNYHRPSYLSCVGAVAVALILSGRIVCTPPHRSGPLFMAITSIIPAPEGHRAALLPRRPERPKITPFVLDRWYHTVPVRLQMCSLGPYGWNVQLRLLQGGLIVFRWRASHLRSTTQRASARLTTEWNMLF